MKTTALALLCSLLAITNVYASVGYYGGPIYPLPTVCTIFYGAVDSGIESTFGEFIIGLQGSGYLAGLYEYSTGTQSFPGTINLGGYTVVSTPTPVVITDATIQNDIVSFLNAGIFPDNPNNFYYVFMGTGVNITAGSDALCANYPNGFCAYHSYFEITVAGGATQYVHYGVGMGAAGPCDHVCGTGTVAQRALGVFSHELVESMTDPYDNAWHDASTPVFNEIGDLCDLEFAVIGLSTGAYQVQRYWSNTQQTCIAPGQYYSGPFYAPGRLYEGDRLYSPNLRYYLTVQTDGNIVGYDTQNNNQPFWWTGTNGQTGQPFFLWVQGDGNLVAYHYPNGAINSPAPMWYSGTCCRSGTFYLTMQNDRNIVLYEIVGGSSVALWSSDFGIA